MAGETMVRCVDCGAEFEFAERDRVYYQEQGWSPPRRCKTCRAKRKLVGNAGHAGHSHGDATHEKASEHAHAVPIPNPGATHLKFRVNCATCGLETSVPFKPDPKRPVFCKSCLAKSKSGRK